MPKRPKQEIMLLKASLRGDSAAFGAIVGDYQSLVCAITYSGTRNLETSEELAQEVFLKAWKSLGQLKDLGKFRAWLCSIARSTVQNWFRSQRRDVVSQAAPLGAAAGNASAYSGPEEAAMIREQRAVVDHALAAIPEGLREPLVLFYREDKSIRQVARQLGLSEPATRQRIARGRSMLRERVAAMVETTIARTKPGAAFKTVVMAAIAATVVRSGATTAAAGSHAVSGGAAGALAGVGAKLTVLAVGVVIVAGGVVAYRQFRKPEPPAAERISNIAHEPQGSAVQEDSGPAPEGRAAATPPATASRTSADGMPESSAAGVEVTEGQEIVSDTRPSTTSAEIRQKISEFRPSDVLSGIITDAETGEPVPDAIVTITMRRLHRTQTDANGFYAFDEVHAAGNFDVAVEAATHVGFSQQSARPALYLSNDTQTVRHFQLPKACMVDVWVVDVNGVGIGDTKVVGTSLVDDFGRSVGHFADRRTDPNGYVLLGGFPPADAEYMITAWHSVEAGFEQRGNVRHRRSERDYALGKAILQLTDPNVIPQVQIVLGDGQDVRGYAEYADGVPAGGIKLVARPAWWHSTYALDGPETADNGTFTFKHITPGAYDIWRHVSLWGGGGTMRQVTKVNLPPADDVPLVIPIPETSPESAVTIEGTITFLGDEVPGPVRVEAYGSNGGFAVATATHAGSGTWRFVLDKLRPGSYTVTFTGGNVEEKTVRDVVAPTSDLAVELVCRPRPKLGCTVVDAKTGEPITRFRARLRKLRTLRGTPWTQQNRWIDLEHERGYVTLDTVGPGIYRIQVAAQSYAAAWTDEINTDDPADMVVALTRGGTITGTIHNGQGETISGAAVIPLSLASGASSRTRRVFVDDEGAVKVTAGAFMMRNVPPGTEALKIKHADYAPVVLENVRVVEGQTTDLGEIVLHAGATVEGRVYDHLGNAQAGQTLYFQDDSGYSGSDDRLAGRLAGVVTDSNGFYRAEHLPDGLCYVMRVNEGLSLGVVRRAVAPRAGHTVRVDLGGTPIVSGAVVLDQMPLANTKLRLLPAGRVMSNTFRCFTTTDEEGRFVFGGVTPGTHAVYSQSRDERNKWLRVGIVKVAHSDVDVGAIPRNAATLSVHVAREAYQPAWSLDRVFLAEAEVPWAVPVRTAEPPLAEGRPWIFRDLEPGRYMLVLVRADQVQWRHDLNLTNSSKPWAVSLETPRSTASVSGRVLHEAYQGLALSCTQEGVFAFLRPYGDGSYAVENLPPGRYAVGTVPALVWGLPPLLEFELRHGQARGLDVDVYAKRDDRTALLRVVVADAEGTLHRDALVQLSNRSNPTEAAKRAQAGDTLPISPGKYTVRVSAPGYRDVTQEVTVKPRDPDTTEPQTLLIRLER